MNLLYNFINIFSLLLFTIIPYKNYKPKSWFYKSLIVHIASFFIINTCNKYIDSWLIPLLCYFNFLILLFVQYTIDKTNWFSFIIILFLLTTFNFDKFKTQCGYLINPDKEWIYTSTILLIIWYSLLNKHIKYTSKIALILLVLYPLLFPIKEYLIHRTLTLSVVASIAWYLN